MFDEIKNYETEFNNQEQKKAKATRKKPLSANSSVEDLENEIKRLQELKQQAMNKNKNLFIAELSKADIRNALNRLTEREVKELAQYVSAHLSEIAASASKNNLGNNAEH